MAIFFAPLISFEKKFRPLNFSALFFGPLKFSPWDSKFSDPLFHDRKKIHTPYFTSVKKFTPLILHSKHKKFRTPYFTWEKIIPYSSQNGISDIDFSKICEGTWHDRVVAAPASWADLRPPFYVLFQSYTYIQLQKSIHHRASCWVQNIPPPRHSSIYQKIESDMTRP